MKIHLVKKSQREYRCNKCGQPIEAGSSYRWWKHRNAPKTKWHTSHGVPGPAVLTTSEKLARLYEAQDAAFSALMEYEEDPETFEDLEQVILDAIQEARDIAAEYEEGADNIEEYFGETEQVSTMRDKSISIEEWADELENIDFTNYENDSERDEWCANVSDIIGNIAI